MDKKQNKNVGKNGMIQLAQELELLRVQVLEVELKARWWKAQYDIRYYTLESEKIQPEYDEYVKVAQEKQEQALKELQEKIKKEGGSQLKMEEIQGDEPAASIVDPEMLSDTDIADKAGPGVYPDGSQGGA